MNAKLRGFTTVELVVIAIVIIGLFLVGWGIYRNVTKRVVTTGQWRTPATTIPKGGQQLFVYSVTRKAGGATAQLPNRALTFRVAPTGDATVTPNAGRTGPFGTLDVTVTMVSDYEGTVQLWAKDTASGQEDPPLLIQVVDNEEEDDDP